MFMLNWIFGTGTSEAEESSDEKANNAQNALNPNWSDDRIARGNLQTILTTQILPSLREDPNLQSSYAVLELHLFDANEWDKANDVALESRVGAFAIISDADDAQDILMLNDDTTDLKQDTSCDLKNEANEEKDASSDGAKKGGLNNLEETADLGVGVYQHSLFNNYNDTLVQEVPSEQHIGKEYGLKLYARLKEEEDPVSFYYGKHYWSIVTLPIPSDTNPNCHFTRILVLLDPGSPHNFLLKDARKALQLSDDNIELGLPHKGWVVKHHNRRLVFQESETCKHEGVRNISLFGNQLLGKNSNFKLSDNRREPYFGFTKEQYDRIDKDIVALNEEINEMDKRIIKQEKELEEAKAELNNKDEEIARLRALLKASNVKFLGQKTKKKTKKRQNIAVFMLFVALFFIFSNDNMNRYHLVMQKQKKKKKKKKKKKQKKSKKHKLPTVDMD